MSEIKRRKTKKIYVGNVPIGGDAEIVVESMVKTDPYDEKKIIAQIKKLQKANCKLVRIALPDLKACDKIPVIKKNVEIPIMGDIHFDYKIALSSIEKGIDSIRLNPGNLREVDKIKLIIDMAKEKKIPIRIGVNSGSIDRKKYPVANADAMVNSALEYIKIFEENNFTDIILSLKSPDIIETIKANEKISQLCDYPLHIGITEAGTKFYGAIKSAIGIGILLYKGIGDTIRVSLSSDPVDEVNVAYQILKSLGLYKGIEIISCPTCGRSEFNVKKVACELEKRLKNFDLNLKVAVMGCVVNGPGEAKDADLGITGSAKKAVFFVKGKVVKTIRSDDIIKEILTYISKNYGVKNYGVL